MRPNISLITLGVRDLNESLKFYRDGLGFETQGKVEDGVIFIQLAGIILGLWSREELAKDTGLQLADGFSGITLAHNVSSREEVDQLFMDLEKMSANIVKKPIATFWGGYSGYFADPDGHVWEVAHNPFWKMDANGQARLS